jgi:hypothetical protein
MVTSAKYENVALAVRTVAKAEAVLDCPQWQRWSGFAVQAEWGINELLPAILRRVAQEISGQDQNHRLLEKSLVNARFWNGSR